MNKILSLLLLLSLTSCSKMTAAQPTFAVVIAQGITLCVILLLLLLLHFYKPKTSKPKTSK